MAQESPPPRPRIPGTVWALGFVSMLMDISSEMIHSLLPLFMVTVLGAPVLAVGLIEGIAEATALIVKIFSGALSDRLGRRKQLALIGYALGAATKPLFALATGPGLLIAARFADRIGKGIRGAPRDALVADVTPPALRGAAFGLRQSLDTVGAFLGPLIATGLMLLWAGDFRAVFWAACVPAALCVVVLIVGVREPPTPRRETPVQPLRREALRALGPAFWRLAAVGAAFSLARFSEAFLVLRAHETGVAIAWVPMLMVAMNLVYAASAYPFGALADRLDHRLLLALGLGVLILADVLLALAPGWQMMLAGIALWGVHMGITQGLLAAMVADVAPPALRGTAYGFFNLFSGVSMLLASLIAGAMWDWLGSSATFLAGAALAGLTLMLLPLLPGSRSG